MKTNTKKVLHEQGAQVVQALKWIGGALFGDADEVLDEIASRGDPRERAPAGRTRAASAPPVIEVKPARATPPRRAGNREVIDVEGFAADEDDE
jgi:hypothetical protein